MTYQQMEDDIYAFIQQYIHQHGRPPTLREIGHACFLSHTSAMRYLDRLEAHGRIQRRPGSRGIALVDGQKK